MRRLRFGLPPVLALLVALSGCGDPMAMNGPTVAELPSATPTVPADTPDSAEVRAYYTRMQQDSLSRGLLRTDGGGPDTPYDARILAANFTRIALYDEYTPSKTGYIDQAEQDPIRKWVMPVRMQLEFGPTVPDAEQQGDRAIVAAYDARLSRLTKLPIALTDATPNFHVFVLNEDERRAFGPRLRALYPGISDNAVKTFTDMPLSIYCFVYNFTPPGTYTYSSAVAIIRAELPDLMRTACYHEELAQALGPANDSLEARPSIFNDDQEFAYLTTQDELILRMLYDPRVKPGMTLPEAEPLVRKIAQELMPGHS
ncbi:MAG: DUF2927 domain-containing protein [Rhodobacteraceae bacterium]|nr:DUF2927 domain-containing protein [Paracoccaceae bacterium]